MSDSQADREKEIPVRYVVRVTLLVLALLVGLPFVGVFALSWWTGAESGVDFWGPIVAIMVSVTSMSVSGIFVFMSFRIDRGVRHETRETVREVLGKEMNRAFEEAGRQAKMRFEEAKDLSQKALREIETEVEKTDADVTERLTQIGVRIDATKKTIDEQCTRAGEEIKERFDRQTKSLDDYFTGVHNLITTLREQVLRTVLIAQPGDAQVTLQWTAGPAQVPELVRWEYQKKEGDGEYGAWKDLPAAVAAKDTRGVNRYDVKELTNGEIYTFRVRDASGDYPISNEAIATPAGPGEPPDGKQDA